MIERTIDIATDVATFLLFHPNDLAHRAHAPTGWYGHAFAYCRDSATGRLIAWGTGGDGGYQVRITSRPLSAEERACVRGSRSFPLVVAHGRVLLDNGDALPGEGQMEEATPNSPQWIEVPNGAYRVTVHALGRGDDDRLPDYVAVFERVESIEGIAVAARLPVLEPVSRGDEAAAGPDDDAADAQILAETEAPYRWVAISPGSGWWDVLTISDDAAILPGMTHTQPVSEEIADHFYPWGRGAQFDPVLTAVVESGRPALTTQLNGRAGIAGRNLRLSMRARAVVRIVEVDWSGSPARVRVAAVDRPDMTADPAAIAALRARLLSHVRAREAGEAAAPTAPAFELERLEALVSAEAVTGWALTYLDMPLGERLALWCSPARDRISAIEAKLPR